MAQYPSLSGNGNSLGEDLPGSITPKSESTPSASFLTPHHEYSLAENSKNVDLRLDYFTPDVDDVTNGTHGRPVHSQALSSPKGCFTSTGVWDVKPEPVPIPSPGHSSLNQVKEELRLLLSSRQTKPSTSTDQQTGQVRKDPPHIQNGVDLERQRRRREQNRQAAQRCRKRKQDLVNSLNRECQSLECSNTELRFQIRTSEAERNELHRLWNAHVQQHACVPNTSIKPRLISPVTVGMDAVDATNYIGNMPSMLTQPRRAENSKLVVNPVTTTSHGTNPCALTVTTSSDIVTSGNSGDVCGTKTLGVSQNSCFHSSNTDTPLTLHQ